MKRYRYTGNKRELIGETALGKVDAKGRFEVQVDRFTHRYSHGWWRQSPQHWERIHPVCDFCGNEVDPELCWCGDNLEGHGQFDGHSPVPWGCTCGYAKDS